MGSTNSDDMLPLPAVSYRGSAGERIQWPTIVEDPKVLDQWWRGRPLSQPPSSPIPVGAKPLRPVGQRIVQATVKGALLGLALLGVVLGVVPAVPWWLQGWHWQIAVAVLLLVVVLRGVRLAALAALAVALVQSVPLVRSHGLLAGELTMVGVATRMAWESVLIALHRP